MDESVTRARRFAIAALTLASMTAAAAGLPDPTRPPALLAAPADAAVNQSAPVLQSVMISPARRVAIISGQTVALGQSYGDFRVVRITESEAVLRHGSEVLTLKLYPDLDKQPVSRTAAPRARTPQ